MSRRRGLLMDYGGVLTISMSVAARSFCDGTGVPPDTLRDVVAEAYASHDGQGPVEQLERGLLSTTEFGRLFAADLERRCGVALDGDDVVARLLSGLALDEAMVAGVARAREHGVATALVSNSWGVDTYPRPLLERLFDAVVISGEVGVRKPDHAIFAMALDALGVEAGGCVFVDDVPTNVAAATQLGISGVVHVDAAGTLPRVAALLGLPAGALGPAVDPATGT